MARSTRIWPGWRRPRSARSAGVWTPSADSGAWSASSKPAHDAIAGCAGQPAASDHEELTEPSLPSLAQEPTAGETDGDHTSPHEALIDRLDSGPVEAGVPDAPVSEPIDVESLFAPEADVIEPAAELFPPEELPPDEIPDYQGAEFDADIASIFGEEATELLEQSEAAFARWRRDRADASQVTELKRLLHTLKGGAAWPASARWAT
jgi:hypothetical protein